MKMFIRPFHQRDSQLEGSVLAEEVEDIMMTINISPFGAVHFLYKLEYTEAVGRNLRSLTSCINIPQRVSMTILESGC